MPSDGDSLRARIAELEEQAATTARELRALEWLVDRGFAV